MCRVEEPLANEAVRFSVKFIRTACDIITNVDRVGEIVCDTEQLNRYYVTLPGDHTHARHIFEDGRYKGSYDPNLAEVLS